MIKKIISGAQSGPAIAALDIAIKLGLDYAGWYRDGQAAPDKYRLERLVAGSHGSVDEQSVAAAQGSLFFIQSAGTSLSLEKIKKIALRLNKPFLIVNLTKESGFFASRGIAGWLDENQIKDLHVDGDGDDPHVASMDQRVADILEATFFLSMMESGIKSTPQSATGPTHPTVPESPPETIEAALNVLERELSLKDRATIANMTADELVSLHVSLGEYINRHFDLFGTNDGLLADCQRRSDQEGLVPTAGAAVIIRALWDRLRATCRIRRIK